MTQAGHYVVAYDISDDRERRRVDTLLCGFGFRVQKSVFECRLSRGAKVRLAAALKDMAPLTGSIRMYPIYPSGRLTVGALAEDLDDGFAYFC